MCVCVCACVWACVYACMCEISQRFFLYGPLSHTRHITFLPTLPYAPVSFHTYTLPTCYWVLMCLHVCKTIGTIGPQSEQTLVYLFSVKKVIILQQVRTPCPFLPSLPTLTPFHELSLLVILSSYQARPLTVFDYKRAHTHTHTHTLYLFVCMCVCVCVQRQIRQLGDHTDDRRHCMVICHNRILHDRHRHSPCKYQGAHKQHHKASSFSITTTDSEVLTVLSSAHLDSDTWWATLASSNELGNGANVTLESEETTTRECVCWMEVRGVGRGEGEQEKKSFFKNQNTKTLSIGMTFIMITPSTQWWMLWNEQIVYQWQSVYIAIGKFVSHFSLPHTHAHTYAFMHAQADRHTDTCM